MEFREIGFGQWVGLKCETFAKFEIQPSEPSSLLAATTLPNHPYMEVSGVKVRDIRKNRCPNAAPLAYLLAATNLLTHPYMEVSGVKVRDSRKNRDPTP